MPIILPCKQYLGFDDRKMMLIGIPLLSMAIPILLNFKVNTDHSYWGHLVPESAVYVIGFWMTFRYIIIAFHKAFPDIKEAKKRIKFSLLSIFLAAPLVKFLLEFVTDQIMNFCQLEEHAMPEYLQLLLNIYIPSGLIVALYEAMYYFTKYKESIVEKEKLEKEMAKILPLPEQKMLIALEESASDIQQARITISDPSSGPFAQK